jgi:catechol 2,3-dioxygenase-like lactoylglutathione lyase family enzyme
MKFVHVVYRTRRFEQMVRWYQTVFDAKVQYQNPALAFLTYDGEHHRFAFANLDILKPEVSEREHRGLIGVDHVAYTYASLKHLLENYAQLKAQGIKPYWCIHHGITVSMYYADPDGNQMEFPPSWRARTSAPIRSALSSTRTNGWRRSAAEPRRRSFCRGALTSPCLR